MGGGGNNTPDNAATTGHVVTYGDALQAGESFVLTDSGGSIIVGFTVPSSYTFASASLIASSQLVFGEAYTLRAGGTLSSSTVFNGLALGDDLSYTEGSEVGTVVMDSTVSHLGSKIRVMGMEGVPGFGGGPGVGTPDGRSFEPPQGFAGDGKFREPPQGFPGDGRPPM